MIDKSFFGRLNRLFKSDSIVLQTGKNTIKVFDTNRIQSNGGRQSNYNNVEKGTRLYQSNVSMVGAFGAGVGGLQQGVLRTTLYQDYEMMDADAVVSSALDVIASLATLSNTEGDILKITTNDENIKNILTNLFNEILNIDRNMFGWIRDMGKYGDNFLYLKILEGKGIVGVTPMSPYMTNIIVNDSTGAVTFTYNQLGSHSIQNEGEYKNYEVAHFSLNSDTNYYPYSKSYIEGARKAWKMLSLVEEASMLHRLTRSADKRLFSIDIGNIAPNEVDGFMENVANKTKKVPLIDSTTGDYNMKYNMMNIIEDFYIPVRGKTSGTTIENISGLSFAGMEDVQYYKQKVYNALKIPKAFLSETADLNGTSTLANMTVNFSNLIERFQKSFVAELEKIAIIHLYSLGITDNNMMNFELRLTSPSIIYEQEKIATWQEKVSLAQQMWDSNNFSSDYIYHNVFNISEDEYDNMRDEILEDKKREFRINQIQTEGNDPLESGKSFGTPHDLANLYNDKVHVQQSGVPNINPEPTEDVTLGRPSEHASSIGTSNNNFGRDPLFKQRSKNVTQQTTLNPSDNNIRESKNINIFKRKTLMEQLQSNKLFNITD